MKKSSYNYVLAYRGNFYLYHPYIGLLRIGEDYYNQYQNENIENFSKDFFELLVKKKFLLNEDIDEYKRIEFMRNRLKYSQDTLLLTIAPTLKCNCNCEYCFVSKENIQMEEHTEKNIIEFLKQRILHGIKILKVTWFGGEPLLAFESIQRLSKEIIALCEKEGVSYQAFLITNGILLNDDIVFQFESLKIIGLQITLDGTEFFHNASRPSYSVNSYKQIMSNLTLFQGKVKPTIRINVSKRNIDNVIDLLACLDHVAEYIDSIVFAPVFSINNTPKQYEKYTLEGAEYAGLEKRYLEYLKDTKLKVDYRIRGKYIGDAAYVLNSFCIDPKGNLYKSSFMLGNENYKLQNIISFNLIECSYNKNYLSYTAIQDFDKKCRECFYFPYCLGGEETMMKGNCDSIKYNFELYLKRYIDNIEG